MVRREFSQLAIYYIDQEMETIPLECLRTLYLNNPSETIYVVKDKKLYGIVAMGNVLYGQRENSVVRINRSFTSIKGYDAIKAYQIFRLRPRIHKLPVISETGELLGDYTRYDDTLYIERNQERLMQKEKIEKVLGQYEAVYLIEPVEKENQQYLKLIEYLDCFAIRYTVLMKEQICEKLLENAICIFLNEDERRSIQCLYGLVPLPYNSRGYNTFRFDILVNTKYKIRMTTYKMLLLQIEKEMQLDELGIEKPTYLLYDRLDKKTIVLLDRLLKHGISSFCIYNEERDETEYDQSFKKEISRRLQEGSWISGIAWENTEYTKEFYDDLLRFEDYEKGIAQREILYADAHLGYKRNITGKYYNIKEGKRVTCNQPVEYIGTIYLVGLCVISGAYVEDQYTIASYLQKILLEKGYPYRVENYGMEMRFDVENRLEEIGTYSTNDLVIFHSWTGEAPNVQGISLEKIFEKNQISCGWVKDTYGHCNHRASQLIADALLEMIEPSLDSKKEKEDSGKKARINFHDIMKLYVQQSYLNLVFSNFFHKIYSSIGTIVMIGDFFNIGHRYLIEQAKQQVDCLIIFVLEEDSFLVPFEERLKLIKEGTKDIENVMIIPSGDFICSRNNFPEIYSQIWDARVLVNAEYDANVFVDYIAEPLHITHRFAGEEPKGKIKRIYHETMRKVLPQKGISFVEVPRVTIDGEIVSTSMVHEYLQCGEYNKAFKLVPESTKQYLMKQFNMTEILNGTEMKE